MTSSAWVYLISVFVFSFFGGTFLHKYIFRRNERSGEFFSSASIAESVVFCLFCTLLNLLYFFKVYTTEPTEIPIFVFSVLLGGAISLSDVRSGYIPNELLALLFLVGFMSLETGIAGKIITSIICVLFFGGLKAISDLFFHTETLGWGDVILSACMGMLSNGITVLLAFMITVIFSAFTILVEKFISAHTKRSFTPLAPAFFVGILFALCVG